MDTTKNESMTEEELSKNLMLNRLQAENAELKAHIERWAKDITFNFDPRTDHMRSQYHPDYCGYCEFSWPCLWIVAKGWKEGK